MAMNMAGLVDFRNDNLNKYLFEYEGSVYCIVFSKITHYKFTPKRKDDKDNLSRISISFIDGKELAFYGETAEFLANKLYYDLERN